MGLFERYLSVWVGLAIIGAGTRSGRRALAAAPASRVALVSTRMNALIDLDLAARLVKDRLSPVPDST